MARHSLSRSGSLPPPFIVPQGEEPVTPESGSGRSSSHLGRVSVRPQSLPTGDTVSEQSTLYTSDDAGNGYTVAEVTPQSAPCSTVYSNLHGVPAACKELCVPRPQHEQARKRKAAAGDRSNSPTDTLLPDVQQGVPVTEGSMQLKQQKKEQGTHCTAKPLSTFYCELLCTTTGSPALLGHIQSTHIVCKALLRVYSLQHLYCATLMHSGKGHRTNYSIRSSANHSFMLSKSVMLNATICTLEEL